MKYKSSIFNYPIAVDGENYLYNLMTSKLIRLNSSIENLAERKESENHELIHNGFLINSEENISDEYETFFRIRNVLSSTMSVLFTTTTECSLACSYCFENRVRRKSMTPDILEQSIDWIEKRLVETNSKALKIILFGGEPLVEPDLAKHLLSRLSQITKKYGVELCPVEMLTNGLNIDRQVLQDLKTLGVKSVQISLDGDEKTNDKRRVRRKDKDNNNSVYYEVLNNLKYYEENFELTVKINFDKSTINTVYTLIDDLFRIGGLKKNKFYIKPEPIAIYKPLQKHEDYNLYDLCAEELAIAFQQIIVKCSEMNIPLDLSAIFPTPCMVSQENSFLLEPNGTLRSCIGAFGMDEFLVGDVSTGCNADNSREKYSTKIDSEGINYCIKRNCSFLPVCDGGCKKEVHLAGAETSSMQCKYDYLKTAVPTYLHYLISNQRKVKTY